MPAKPYNTVEKTWYLAELEIPLSEIDNYTLDELHEMYKVRDIYPGVLISLEKDGFAANAVVTATDNGDGGVTLATTPSSKFPKYAYAEATYFKIANAVQLAINPPQPLGPTASAGVTQRAAREDHVHLLPVKKPPVLNYPSGRAMALLPGAGNMTFGTLNRLNLVPVYVQVIGGGPLTCSQIGVNVTGAVASSFIRFGMWGIDANGRVDFTKILFDSGQISSATTGVKNFAYTTPIPEGVYYCGVACQGATGAQIAAGATDMVISNDFSSTGGGNNVAYKAGVSGALPTTGSFDDTNGDGPPQFLFTRA